MNRREIKYRADVDGLRAVAVIPVIFFHAGFAALAGGFLGVDVFFVISGYLITSIIQRDLEQGSFSFLRFYERRARRILPALTVVLAACVPMAMLWMLPKAFVDFSRSVLTVCLFVSNVLFWRESGYFAAPNDVKPLLHTWSLSIEEQFYLLFPIMMLLLWRFRRRWLLPVMIATAVLSLGIAEWSTSWARTAAFYLLPARAWELAVGAIVATLARENRLWESARARQLLPLMGLVMIAWAIMTLDSSMRHPGFITAIPVMGVALVLAFGGADDLGSRFLSTRPLVGIGLISYSLYLWHQPLFVFARLRSIGPLAASTYALLIALAFLLAYASWRFVETPFRRPAVVGKRMLWLSAAGAATLFISIGAWGHLTAGAPARLPATARMEVHAERSMGIALARNGSRCHDRSVEGACSIGDGHRAPTYSLVGDSHAAAIATSFDRALQARGESALQLTAEGCPYAPGLDRRADGSRCFRENQARADRLRRPDIRTVVLMGRYVLQMEGSRFDNGEGGVESGETAGFFPQRASVDLLPDTARRRAVAAGFQSTIRDLLAEGKRVVLVYPFPEVGWNVPETLFKLHLSGLDDALTTSYARFLVRSRATIDAFDAVGGDPNLVRVHPQRLFCNAPLRERCVTHDSTTAFYFDDDHPSIEGSDRIVEELFREVDRAWPDERLANSVRTRLGPCTSGRSVLISSAPRSSTDSTCVTSMGSPPTSGGTG